MHGSYTECFRICHSLLETWCKLSMAQMAMGYAEDSGLKGPGFNPLLRQEKKISCFWLVALEPTRSTSKYSTYIDVNLCGKKRAVERTGC